MTEGRMGMALVQPATRLRTDYNRIAELARKTGEPVYITRKDIPELVLMDFDAFQEREQVIKLSDIVLSGDLERLREAGDLSIEEAEAVLKKFNDR